MLNFGPLAAVLHGTLVVSSSLRIRSHLPVPIVIGGGDKLGNVQLSERQKHRDLDLDLASGHTAYRRASLIELYLHTKC